MVEIIKIEVIKGADYNPRKIKQEQFDNLKDSIRTLGFCLPIIVNKINHTIIAGHQRVKAAKDIGLTEIPAYLTEKDIFNGDEIKFNQLHNGCDMDKEAQGRLKTKYPIGFGQAKAEEFILSNAVAPIVKEICKLVMTYGNYFCAVISGDIVVLGHNYIKACSLLNIPVNISVIDSTLKDNATKAFMSNYGEYSYDMIPRNTYVQGLAQLHRRTEKQEGKKQWASTLYERLVMPYLSNNRVVSLLDFGCGKGAYIEKLAINYKAIGVEFYNNNGYSIDVKKGNFQIDQLIKHLDNYGLFDIVICDSVLNSVDSKQAENAVLTICNLFTKDRLFISGRPLDDVAHKLNIKKDRCVAKRFVEFLDENNFSGYYRAGNWYFQHWHSKEDIEKLMQDYGFKIEVLNYGDNSWQVLAKKVNNLSVEQYKNAIDFEFNLPIPNGRYGRNNDAWQAVKKLL